MSHNKMNSLHTHTGIVTHKEPIKVMEFANKSGHTYISMTLNHACQSMICLLEIMENETSKNENKNYDKKLSFDVSLN